MLTRADFLLGGDNVNLVPGFLENGLYAVRTFDSGSLATPVPDMGVARWYPTTCTLQDGTTLIAGGSTAEGGGYGSDSALNEPTYQVSSILGVPFQMTICQARLQQISLLSLQLLDAVCCDVEYISPSSSSCPQTYSSHAATNVQ